MVERGRIRRKLVEMIMNRHEEHLKRLKRRMRRYILAIQILMFNSRHASFVGHSLMIMGVHAQSIHDQSVDPYMKLVEREQLRKKRLGDAERRVELYSLSFAFIAFTVRVPQVLP